jgi:hypothetical protein
LSSDEIVGSGLVISDITALIEKAEFLMTIRADGTRRASSGHAWD